MENQEFLYTCDMKKTFSAVIQEYMQGESLSQKKLALKLGVSTGLINDWVKGRSQPGYDSLQNIAEKLEVSADFLLGLTDTY